MYEKVIQVLFSLGLIFTLYSLIFKNVKIKDKQLRKVTCERDFLLAILYLYLILRNWDF